jgi:hypothetical protein
VSKLDSKHIKTTKSTMKTNTLHSLRALAPALLATLVFPGAALAGETSAEATIDFVSAYINSDGSIANDGPVLQPVLSLSRGIDSVEGLSLGAEVAATYSFSRYEPAGQTQDHCFTEIGLEISGAYEISEGLAFKLYLGSTQYPNLEGANGEELLGFELSKELALGDSATITFGAALEYTLTGDFEGNFNIYPSVGYSKKINDDLTVGLTAATNYALQDGSEVDAWTAYSLTASVGYKQFTAYVAYFGQVSDKIYTDEINDQRDVIVGLSYAVDL